MTMNTPSDPDPTSEAAGITTRRWPPSSGTPDTPLRQLSPLLTQHWHGDICDDRFRDIDRYRRRSNFLAKIATRRTVLWKQ
jgi:hypothetical protein